MEFTFGIITGGNQRNNLIKIIKNINTLGIEKYEIIIIGNEAHLSGARIITFDENQKPMWITRKKNIITKEAKYENIVYMHDYICPNKDWYNGFVEFGNDFTICMSKMLNPNGTRYRDWTLDAMARISHLTENNLERLLPYEETSLSRYMYISGAYWIAKKEIMLQLPLNETLSWGESEDIEWSYRARKMTNFSINSMSSVSLMKYKDPSFVPLSNATLLRFKNMSMEEQNIILSHEEDYYRRMFCD